MISTAGRRELSDSPSKISEEGNLSRVCSNKLVILLVLTSFIAIMQIFVKTRKKFPFFFICWRPSRKPSCPSRLVLSWLYSYLKQLLGALEALEALQPVLLLSCSS